jgi:SSS family solute:Na+ symporter
VRPEFFFFLAGYFVVLLLVGLKFSRRMTGLEDFFLASRSLPASLVLISLTASWFGATSILVTTDQAFRFGVSALWLVGVPAVATVILLGLFLAGPIRRSEGQTLPGLIEARYGRRVRHAASVLILWYMIVLASSQMVALGQFLRPFLGLPYVWGLGLGTAVVLVYLLSGGLFSVVATDVLQCFLLTLGLAGLSAYLVRSSQIGAVVMAARQAGYAGYFNFFHDGQRNALIALSFVLAWTISPIAWQRIQAAGSVRKARQGLLAAAGVFIVLYGLVVCVGVLSRPLFSGQSLPHPVVAEIVASRVGILGGALLFIVVVAAILSTMDTAINAGAMTLTRDILARVSSPSWTGPRRAVMTGRLATVGVALLAFGIAARLQSILETLGLASEIMAEGLFVPGMAMFVLKKRTPSAGALSLILGGGFALLSFLSTLRILPISLPPWPFSVPYGVALSIFGFALGYLIDSLSFNRHGHAQPIHQIRGDA